MRILALSDIHGSTTGLMTTIELCQRYEPDLAVVCGDITQFGPHEWAENFLDRIPVRSLAVPGNCDPKDLDQTIERSSTVNLHRRSVEISGLPFIGAGGADHTPFNTIFEFGDNTFSRWLKPLMKENAVLVTHAPPHGILDENYSGKHRGSKSLRKIVDRWKPMLMLAGHMHEARGVVVHNETVCVNPGPAKNGFGALVELVTPRELKDSGEMDDLTEPEMWTMIRESLEAELLRA